MKTFSMIAAAVLLAATGSAFAGGGGHKMMDPKMMDTNGDGMISKDEFMKHHEMMWDKMKKNSAGMVSVKDMGMMMHEEHMKPADKMEKDKAK